MDLELSVQDNMKEEGAICHHEGQEHAWGYIKCIWLKALSLKTIQKSNIHNQGKFNVNDSLIQTQALRNN